MHVEKLTEIAEWLEAGAPHRPGVDQFKMTDSIGYVGPDSNSACGTVCCIAGAAIQFDAHAKGEPLFTPDWKYANGGWIDSGPLDIAEKVLDLTNDQGLCLFLGYNTRGKSESLHKITAPWAARCIRKFIATGEVDWTGTREGEGA